LTGSAQPHGAPRGSTGSRADALLGARYFGSGATGLCYEILWSRMFGVQFGASLFGIAATLAAFMLGLGAGGLLARRAGAMLSPGAALRVFALLELSVAAYALALPGLRAAAAPGLEDLGAQLDTGAWLALQGASAVALLALPASAMGASFPVVLAALPDSARRVGRIYGLNCLGAASGAVLCLGLLEALGWAGALHAVAAGGALIAAGAWLLARRAPGAAATGAGAGASAAADASANAARALARGPLFAYAGVGAAAMVLELSWMRLYGMVLLRTEYVLAIILAIYLLGAALGSLIAARAGRAAWLAPAVPLLACGGALLGVATLPALSVWNQQRSFSSLGSALALQALVLALSTLPVTAALGAWLPLLARRAAPADAAPEPARAALLYAANCAGAALGAVAAVALFIPRLGSTASVCLAAVALLALGWGLPPAGPARRGLALALPLAAAAAIWLHPFPEPDRLLAPGSGPGRELARYEDALTLHQVTEAADGQRTLLTDLQHMDASTDPAAVRIQADQARLALLLQRDPHSILFLGLGTGIAAAGSLPYPDLERTAVELSPGAVAAARTWFAPANGNVLQRLRVEEDDARHFLVAHARQYDVIVGDLFHPDLAGMSNLLSVEQFTRARRRLQPQGVFVQWLALNQFDAESLHTVLRSFRYVFPDGVGFFDGMHLALVGSPTAQAYGANLLTQLARLDATPADARTGGEGPWTWLARYCGPLEGGTGPLQSEARPVIDYRLPRLRYGTDAALPGLLRELLRQRPTLPQAMEQLGIGASGAAQFADAYLGAGLAMQGWLAALEDQADIATQRLSLAYESNPREHWVASALADRMFDQAQERRLPLDRAALARILRVFPEHVEALRALWHLDRAAGDPAAAAQDLERLRAVAPLDREVAATGA
jgi:spermidine synthase